MTTKKPPKGSMTSDKVAKGRLNVKFGFYESPHVLDQLVGNKKLHEELFGQPSPVAPQRAH
jgi:hypothetical protein